MNSKDLIQDTLTLKEGVPLFDFNVNFTALKKLLVDFNLNINNQKEEIDELRMLLRGKADKEIVSQYTRFRLMGTLHCSTVLST